ncbi:MAG: class I SAM-dependent RNA methyltransferase [Acidobacteriota bacterium]|nr:class I SAM-dependent RNA methyltransferase [Acidobacteriota bacterium]
MPSKLNELSEPFEIEIEKMVYGGEGLGRREGQVILTPFVLSGETARAAPERAQSNVLRARLLEVLTASPDRVSAPCVYFGKCGGCHYQHATYERQLQVKRAILIETLQRVGKIAPPETFDVVSAEPWGYRNRVQLHVQDRKIGYVQARSHKLCAIDHCPIGSPAINTGIQTLTRMIRDRRWPKFIGALELFTNETEMQLNVLETAQPVARRFFEWCAEEIPALVPGALEYGEYRVSRGSFFQVNRFLLQQMIDVSLPALSPGAEGKTALDLYAGVGLFSLPLARRFAQVTAVESGSGAVRDLQFNAERAGVAVHAETSSVDAYLSNLESAPDFVLADPPRAGLGKHVVARLAQLKPREITVVACDPATLARDLAALITAGYDFEQLTLIDLFPQTFHIEAIAKLRLPGAA